MQQFLDDAAYRQLQNELMANPRKGDVMPGCGGLRKMRAGHQARGKGKRGGARVIYLNIPEADRIDLVAIYGKGEKDDLTQRERRSLAALARQARAEAITDVRKKGGKQP